MNTCPICGSSLEHVTELAEIPVGRAAAEVELTFDRCPSCGEEFVDPDVYTEAQAEAATIVRDNLGLLQPEEILAIRERAGVTQGELEELLGTGPKAVGRWERGTVLQSGMADKLLRVFQQCPGVLHELLRDRSGDVLRHKIPSLHAGEGSDGDVGTEPEVTSTTIYRLRERGKQEGHLEEDMAYAA